MPKVLVVYELRDSDNEVPLWVQEAREALRTSGAVQIAVRYVLSREECRRLLYKFFGGRHIEVRYKYDSDDKLMAEVMIGKQIRTTAQATPPRHKICPVCMESKPLEEFPLRVAAETALQMQAVGKEPPHYSYCRECYNAYNRWRTFFLKTHQADRLVPVFSDGQSPNKEFREYLERIVAP